MMKSLLLPFLKKEIEKGRIKMGFKEEYREYEDIKVEIKVLGDKKEKREEELAKRCLEFQALCDRLKKEKRDVDQLEQFSLAQVLAKITGKLEAKQEKEYSEYIQAKREYDEASYSVQAIEQDIARLDHDVLSLQQKLSQKEEYLVSNYEEAKQMNETINHEREEHLRIIKEYKEAIGAVSRTIRIANDMKDSLGSAKSYATFDTFFNGGIFADMAKYSEIDRAQSLQNELMEATKSMNKELLDVDICFHGGSVEISGTTRAFDMFFDNIFTDWNVRNQIEENYLKMEDYVGKLQSIKADLMSKKNAEEVAANNCQF